MWDSTIDLRERDSKYIESQSTRLADPRKIFTLFFSVWLVFPVVCQFSEGAENAIALRFQQIPHSEE